MTHPLRAQQPNIIAALGIFSHSLMVMLEKPEGRTEPFPATPIGLIYGLAWRGGYAVAEDIEGKDSIDTRKLVADSEALDAINPEHDITRYGMLRRMAAMLHVRDVSIYGPEPVFSYATPELKEQQQ